MNISHMLEGWRNLTFPPEELREKIKQVREERLAICSVCPLYSKNIDPTTFKYCTVCGCPIKAKTSALSTQCPDTPPRWLAVATEEEEDKIDEILKS